MSLLSHKRSQIGHINHTPPVQGDFTIMNHQVSPLDLTKKKELVIFNDSGNTQNLDGLIGKSKRLYNKLAIQTNYSEVPYALFWLRIEKRIK